MRLLILGGTVFLGRHASEQALERGHQLTLFTRGQTNAGLFPDAEHLYGDRDGGLAPLAGREFDAVIDTSGYFPRVVADSARLLAPTCGHCTFVSSVSVYDQNGGAGSDVDGPVGTIDDVTIEEITETSYGPLKALCERAATDAFGERALVVRPGFIVGPHDPTDRFVYWPRRVAQGGTMVAPGPPERPMQVIDVRDLAGWMLTMIEQRAGGVYNATNEGVPMADFLAACPGEVEVTWLDDGFLVEHGVGESDLPLWSGDPSFAALHEADVAKAVGAGLTFRPVEETAADTIAWDRTRKDTKPVGLTPEREAELIAAWASLESTA